MRKLLLLAFALVTFSASAQPIKIGHAGVSTNDIILRKLTAGSDTVVMSLPGARGAVAFDALDQQKIDALAINAGAMFAYHETYSTALRFDPSERFKVVSILSSTEAVIVMPKKYRSIDALVEQKCVPGQVVFVASIGGIDFAVVREALRTHKCVIEEVMYKTHTASLLDIAAERVDITSLGAAGAAQYSDRTTIVSVRSHKSDLLRRFSYDTLLLVRKDAPDSMIRQILSVLQSGTADDGWQQTLGVNLRIATGSAAQAEAKIIGETYRRLLAGN